MTPSSLAAAARRAGRLRPADAVTLVAVGTVVLLVSLPRLREFALRENESDARRLIERLGEISLREAPLENLSPESGSPPAANAQPARSVQSLVEASALLARQLDDAEFLGESLLRRHGYLIDVARGPSGGETLRAWPWRHGRTGLRAFVRHADGTLAVHDNRDGRWSGPERPPPPEALASAGWKRLASGG